jgi:hypothetical protein
VRSRPNLKTYLRPAVVTSGQTMLVEVVLTSTSETPVDFVRMQLHGYEVVRIANPAITHTVVRLEALHGPRTLGVGEHRLAARFELPAGVPPSYAGSVVAVSYTLDVHVAIPWWPDRRGTFAVPVVSPPVAQGHDPQPQTVVSSLEGPRGTEPYVEVSYDSTVVEIGGVLAGAVSVGNLGNRPVRGVSLELVAVERTRQGHASKFRRARWRIHDGGARDGEPMPFRVRVPRELSVPIEAHLFEVSFSLQVVVDVAWGSDVKVRTPVTLVPAQTDARASARAEAKASRWVAPVGRERRALIWSTVAHERGLVNDAANETMSATIDAVALEIRLEQRGADGLYALATYRWPNLGIGLHVEPRRWTDVIARAGKLDLGHSTAAAKFTAHAREAAQATALLGAEALGLLARFEEARVDDDGAVVARRGSAQTKAALDAFVTLSVTTAQALARGLRRVPPPASMAAAVPAWDAFARHLGGRLDRGPMAIRGATFGAQPVEVETLWMHGADVAGTAVRVPLSPPLERALDPDAPDLSREARDLVAAITAEARDVHLGPTALEALVQGPLEDPASVEPLLEKLVRLARAMRGVGSAGPFR